MTSIHIAVVCAVVSTAAALARTYMHMRQYLAERRARGAHDGVRLKRIRNVIAVDQ